MKKQKEIIEGTAILLAGFVIGIIVAIIVVESNIPSGASNDGWLGFFGGLFGSVISGFVAYFILHVNRKETTKIQEDQKKQIEYQVKRQFADDIAKTIAAYITDICNYSYSQYLNQGKGEDKREKVNRIIAVEKYHEIHLKLYKIKEAERLLGILDEVHKKCIYTESYSQIEKFEQIVQELTEESKKFIYEYTLKDEL